ncbi:MAG: hypothetical protein GTO45_30485 [Candidatus Aminicenantes bacterium]|nr:hypothetical protein [Candidatus Aminicenantes bacterium]NIM83121.1 hypothetical protein [Candidatus Aminicenantes bacterium]NIN22500.1 hypothetical protein [Candidatus Aminicenantes bacterium]NIN46268.1 hypothetical protein [Candidatus Aminicenantes bacterium]NIN89106.1 hypothetical protein [Candidatus Aminicenantes bacterium]
MKESILVKSDNLKDYFKEKPVFDVNEIREYFRRSDPNLTEATLSWFVTFCSLLFKKQANGFEGKESVDKKPLMVHN